MNNDVLAIGMSAQNAKLTPTLIASCVIRTIHIPQSRGNGESKKSPHFVSKHQLLRSDYHQNPKCCSTRRITNLNHLFLFFFCCLIPQNCGKENIWCGCFSVKWMKHISSCRALKIPIKRCLKMNNDRHLPTSSRAALMPWQLNIPN